MANRIIRAALIALSVLVLLGTVVFLAVYWKRIPDRVPMRFDGRGEIVGWGAKASLLLLPVLNAVLTVALSFAKTVNFSTLRRVRRYPAPPLLFPLMSLMLTLGLSYMTVCIALVRPLGLWFTPVFPVVSMLPLVVYIVQMLAGAR